MAPLSNVLIHIGYQKTGSTWLQNQLFVKNNSVFEPLNEKKAGSSNLGKHFFRGKDDQVLSPFDLNQEVIQKTLKEYINKHPVPARKIPVLSNERLAGNAHAGGFDAVQIASRLKTTFPNGKILITIREQKHFILSIYYQYLGRGGTMSLKRYLNCQYDGKRPYFSPHHINYLLLVKHYTQLFGKENVKVIPYELFEVAPEKFINSIGKFVGRSLEVDLKLFEERINKTSNHYSKYHFRNFNRFLFSNSLNDFSLWGGKYFRKPASIALDTFSAITPSQWDRAKNVSLTKQISDWVGDRYKKNNEELSQIIETDLSLFGY